MTERGPDAALAEELGIEWRYRDQAGKIRESPEATVRALCKTLGAAAVEPMPLPPAVVLREDRRPHFAPIRFEPDAVGVLVWEVIEENGLLHRGAVQIEELAPAQEAEARERFDRRLLLPDTLPLGYHRLILRRGAEATFHAETRLILAPSRAYQPAALCSGRQLWGIAIQLYALRSARNWGMGDFTDLADFVERAAAAGAAAVGLNPLHALFLDEPEQASPYSPNSRSFLNPLYLDAEAIEDFAECAEAQSLRRDPAFAAELAALRSAELVDYTRVATCKLRALRLLYNSFRREHLVEGHSERARAFRAFQERRSPALRRFATFEALREWLSAEDPARRFWRNWPEALQEPDSPTVAAFVGAHEERIEFSEYLQWQADLQLRHCVDRAEEASMPLGLYHDLAVGSAAGSAEAWLLQKVQVQGWSIGAPPDVWNMKGQNWGLSPLHPHALRQAGYAHFAELLRANMRYAGALRIDHALGLMRQFWIAEGSEPQDGAYVRFPLADLLAVIALESHRQRCLVIGEDLGTVPEGFQKTLQEAGILSYRLLYFEREENGRFVAPKRWPAQALAAVTTHDLPTLPAFWTGHDIAVKEKLGLYPSSEQGMRDRKTRQQDKKRLAKALAAEGLAADPDSPNPPIEPVYRFLARTPCQLLMVQLEDPLEVRDQINLPGTTEAHPNWRRKVPLPNEILFSDSRVRRLAEVLLAERPEPHPADPSGPKPPSATYRLQFNAGFTFRDATALVPYLRRLGITHLYASSFLRARPGSTHGYDITDHNALNLELGTPEDFAAYCLALRQAGLRQILDFIPNHMGIGRADNAWWLDVLEWGEASAYASFFDIDWLPRQGELRGKLLVPLLGAHYGLVLTNGDIKLRFDAVAGSFSAWYHEHRLPIRPADYPSILERALARKGLTDERREQLLRLADAFRGLRSGSSSVRRRREAYARFEALKLELAALARTDDGIGEALGAAAASFDGSPGDSPSFLPLHRLLERQAYRLAFWRVAADEINYRRFFDINELAGIRMENPEVFDLTHRLVARLIAGGDLHGLRLDHVDGLFDPEGYFRRLQALACGLGPGADPSNVQAQQEGGFFIIVEKILARHEHLRESWPVAGTTGYEFANLVNGLFIDPAGEQPLDRTYRRFLERAIDFDEMLYDCKNLIMDTVLASELNVLANELDRLSNLDWFTRDFTQERLRAALKEVVACFPVYRTYVSESGVAVEDRRDIDWAVSQARRRYTGPDPEILDFVHAALSTDLVGRSPAFGREAVLRFAMKFQQYTGPVTAKSLEDTAFYRYNRLLSLNEVGGDPRQFGTSVAAFHRVTQERARRWPHAMLATATHDTKRGEDVRTRIDALSELPQEWDRRVRRWAVLNRSKRREVEGAPAPSRNDEYMIYQTLVGAWPMELAGTETPPQEALEPFIGRLQGTVLKAIREAKRRTSWINPDAAYEEACTGFVARILDIGRTNPFLQDFLPFQEKVARLGALNSLSQTAVKLMAPGVPDIYRGCELWDLSMVDPDNRRPVDFERRRLALAEVESLRRRPLAERLAGLQVLLRDWRDGRIKLYVTAALLALRRRRAELFAEAAYEPQPADGAGQERILAFARGRGSDRLIVAAGRLFAPLLGTSPGLMPPASAWEDTAVVVGGARARFRDALTGRGIDSADGRIAASLLFRELPAAVLVPQD